MAVAADVPGKYDLVLTVGSAVNGYTFLRTLDGSYLSANRHRAEYTSTPTFLERQNVSGKYGDDSQAFFLTASQNDWSAGEQQRYYRTDVGTSRYWTGTNVDVVTTPGQVALSDAVKAISFTNAMFGSIGTAYIDNKIYTMDSTNLFSVNGAGTKTDLGAHGAGSPFARAITTDGIYVYVGGATKIRKWKILTPAFTDFSAAAYMALAFLNNTLFGVPSVMSEIGRFDTSGTYSTVYTWKGAEGTVHGVVTSLLPWGPKLLILRSASETYQGSELWITDGTITSKIAAFAPNFIGDQMAVANGVVFIGGAFFNANKTTYQSAVLYYANGSTGLLWKSTLSNTNLTFPSLAAFKNGLVFTDETLGNFMFYDPTNGGVSTIGTFTTGSVTWANDTGAFIGAGGTQFLHTRNATGTYFFPDTAKATSGTITSSLFDFDNSLTKVFRGIKIDYVAGTDGNGGSVDVSYQVDSVDGSFTSLATGVASGAETLFGSTVTGRAISVKVTINKGTSTFGPLLKRVYVRAAPVLQSYKIRTYNLDLSSTVEHPTRLEDTSHQPLTGFQQVQNLQTAISSTTPITITDKFGTFTGVCEPSQCSILELHSEGGSHGAPGQYTAQITVREV